MTTARRRKLPEGEPVADCIELEPPFESVTIGYGEELYSPVQFNSFRVGGHSVTLKPKQGETGAACIARASAMLEELVAAEFEVRLVNFRKRFGRTGRG